MSQINVNNIKNRAGTGAPTLGNGVVVTGVVTATTGAFSGNVSIGGTLTYEDVTNIDAVGIVTARTGLKVLAGGANVVGASTFSSDTNFAAGKVLAVTSSGAGLIRIQNSSSADTIQLQGGDGSIRQVVNINSSGIVTAQQGIRIGAGQSIGSDGAAVVYYGDGSNLEGVVSGITLRQAGTTKNGSLTIVDFASGATITTDSNNASTGIATVSIVASIQTTSSSPSANSIVTLDLSSAQHHDLTLTAGITTITCSGGTLGDSHSVIINQPSSGIATVGFSTYFLFPSGSTPSISEGSSKIDLISFVVKRVGAAGTQLLASAGLNYQ